MEFGYVDSLKDLVAVVTLCLTEEELKSYNEENKDFTIKNRIVDMTPNTITICSANDYKEEEKMKIIYGYDYNIKKYYFDFCI